MALHQEILAELAELDVDDRTLDLVMASLEGGEAVEQVLAGGSVEYATGEEDGADADTSSVYLNDVTVSGFRGIGPEVKLELPLGPGLTVVVGRNGSGKSSFAEALELLLTGDTLRWKDRTGVWKEGWRNLHYGSAPRISARFRVEGKTGFTTVERRWSENGELDEASSTAQHHGEKRTDLAGIGWDGPLELYRPLLSYNELGMIGARPSELFDTLAAVLGLEELGEATKVLAAVRLRRAKREKEVNRERLDHLLPSLEALEDERAKAAVKALRKRVWDLDTLADLGSAPEVEQDSLGTLAALQLPDEEHVLRVAERLEVAYTGMLHLAGTDAERAQRLVGLLSSALEHHRRHGDEPCPVCGVGTLDSAWRGSAEEQIEQLNKSARRYREAERQLQEALNRARALVAIPALPSATGLDTTALNVVWTLWASLPDQFVDIPGHLLSTFGSVLREVERVSELAASRYSERERIWAAVLPDLMAWVAKARTAVTLREAIGWIRAAEGALKSVTVSLRAARWVPIETKALGLWRDLRLHSNADLQSVELAGSRTRRHVDLKVVVDGEQAQALAVASQGEISCLALSLFFPRATLPTNPFRFLVIDDPIQSMDPARVDGLARVFSEIAKERQLIVFTHDDRLPESLRRLQISHTCRQVTRHLGSVVEVRETLDPMRQYFWDARAVARDDGLLAQVAWNVIPGICREGLEAACVDVVRRRRLGRGESHAAVERLLEGARTLIQKAALALFDDMGRSREVSTRITREWGSTFTDAFRGANRGAHHRYRGDLTSLINDCQGLAERIRVKA